MTACHRFLVQQEAAKRTGARARPPKLRSRRWFGRRRRRRRRRRASVAGASAGASVAGAPWRRQREARREAKGHAERRPRSGSPDRCNERWVREVGHLPFHLCELSGLWSGGTSESRPNRPSTPYQGLLRPRKYTRTTLGPGPDRSASSNGSSPLPSLSTTCCSCRRRPGGGTDITDIVPPQACSETHCSNECSNGSNAMQ